MIEKICLSSFNRLLSVIEFRQIYLLFIHYFHYASFLSSEYEGKQINGYTVTFTEYNCTAETSENEELMNKYKIEGYPTIKLLKGGQVIEYDAKPTKVTMEQFLHTVL